MFPSCPTPHNGQTWVIQHDQGSPVAYDAESRMTWAQNTFALCFLILVPTMGLVTAACYRQRGRSRFSGFVAGTFIGGMTFIGCCLLAMLCFPRYPMEEISEWVANAFTLPLLGACLLLTWFFPASGP